MSDLKNLSINEYNHNQLNKSVKSLKNNYAITVVIAQWFYSDLTEVRNTEKQLIRLLLSSLLPSVYLHSSPRACILAWR